MSGNIHLRESETVRIIIPRNNNSEVLLCRRGERHLLPQVTIPKWDRFARCVTETVAGLWSLTSLCLFEPQIRNKSRDANQDKYVVMELRDPHWRPGSDLIWVSRDNICSGFQAPSDARALQEILEKADSYNAGALPGPFARAGWFDGLMSWANDRLTPEGLQLTGTFQQFNGGPFFNLIRLETNAQSVWFKAVGEPSLHEYGITISLAARHPTYFPKVLAAHPNWHAWLAEEVGGVPLEQTQCPRAWSIAASTLGRMQHDFSDDLEALLAAGCRDFRIGTILPQIDRFAEEMIGVMRQQTANMPKPLSPSQLADLATHLKYCCYRLQELGIRDSIGNTDFNPGNITSGAGKCMFLDWAHAYIGHPFTAFEYLLWGCHKYFPQLDSCHAEFEEHYLHAWDGFTSRKVLTEALALARVIAPLFKCLSIDNWDDTRSVLNSSRAPWLRTYARRIHAEIQRALISALTKV